MSSVKNDTYILAGAAQDSTGSPLRPAAIHWCDGQIVAAGPPDRVACPPGARVLKFPNRLILPGLVNAHAHLDLTAIGPAPYGGDFIEWIEFVRDHRPTDPDALAASVRLGIDKSVAGGTAIIGDIAGVGSTIPFETLRADGRLRGVSFAEFFGLGSRQQQAVDAMERLFAAFPCGANDRVHLSLQPHAPYSAGPEVYRAASRLAAARGMVASTHLAETQAEVEFALAATGPFAEFLHRIDRWDELITPLGQHPIDAFSDILRQPTRWVAAHVHYASATQIRRLTLAGAAVVHCPRATAYFEHQLQHYQLAMRTGRFALGTDSMINLDRTDRISILDEMSLLHRRDRIEPAQLLAVATVGGAMALGIDPQLVTLAPGPSAGLISVEFDPNDPTDALVQVVSDPGSIEWVVHA